MGTLVPLRRMEIRSNDHEETICLFYTSKPCDNAKPAKPRTPLSALTIGFIPKPNDDANMILAWVKINLEIPGALEEAKVCCAEHHLNFPENLIKRAMEYEHWGEPGAWPEGILGFYLNEDK